MCRIGQVRQNKWEPTSFEGWRGESGHDDKEGNVCLDMCRGGYAENIGLEVYDA